MTLIARFRTSWKLLEKQQALINAQNHLLELQQQELRQLRLGYLREMQGIVAAWLIHTDQPELDLRHDLADLEAALGHQVAILEEHVI